MEDPPEPITGTREIGNRNKHPLPDFQKTFWIYVGVEDFSGSLIIHSLISWELNIHSWFCRLRDGPLTSWPTLGGLKLILGNGQCGLVSRILLTVWSDIHWEETFCPGKECCHHFQEIPYWALLMGPLHWDVWRVYPCRFSSLYWWHHAHTFPTIGKVWDILDLMQAFESTPYIYLQSQQTLENSLLHLGAVCRTSLRETQVQVVKWHNF